MIGTVAMLVAYFFATNQYEKQLWLLLAVGPALLTVAGRGGRDRGEEPRNAEASAPPRRRGLGLLPHDGAGS